jgi:hypothetical protein
MSYDKDIFIKNNKHRVVRMKIYQLEHPTEWMAILPAWNAMSLGMDRPLFFFLKNEIVSKYWDSYTKTLIDHNDNIYKFLQSGWRQLNE